MKKIVLFGDSLFNGYRAGRDTDVITSGVQKNLGITRRLSIYL
ncbi:hypothetical protein SDC49_09245 [Lactobacillus sp. R2/2]|nr:hypothetical protein [Lactobacillus sp. R2/2]